MELFCLICKIVLKEWDYFLMINTLSSRIRTWIKKQEELSVVNNSVGICITDIFSVLVPQNPAEHMCRSPKIHFKHKFGVNDS